MNPEKIVNGLGKELTDALQAMAKTKDLQKKEAYSRIIKNLSKSLASLFEMASDAEFYGYSYEGNNLDDDDLCAEDYKEDDPDRDCPF
ncbi:hypothetical protein LZ24_00377 [Desulfobotulus alkaliphilus]|uniref:Uncharacterized protein n=1 Tax=Desulfobotulus alkaliphilus TaxID=622671 RepID=A0A562S8K5_9BACT|nr:hypothetical protein [Desulfobotulus alkaliphilus]TWI76756.1 hypothetical protein LZ24_00377 [Desulfobotulus alkaliphilus]